ncbi:MAG: winged helix-turn-helix domain-containing protein [Candidatus Cloacimonadota bacterium]|nr:winged helix-turn-helix domain-containing protein [Candidatus Cloacimonadota bacterium]
MVSKIEIHYSVVNDFIISISRIISDASINSFISKYDQDLADKVKLDEKISKWVKSIKKEIDKDKLDLMDYFGNRETMFRLVLLHMNCANRFKAVDEFMNFLKSYDSSELITKYFELIFKIFDIKNDGIKELSDSSFLKIINETNFPSNRKWELLQIYNNPEETKQNLLLLLNWYYKNHFKKVEKKITKVGEKYVNVVNQKIKNYGNEYIELLTGTDYSKDKNLKTKVVLSISYYLELLSLYLERMDIDEDIYFLGFRYDEVFVERKHRVMSNVHLFKALSDETRQNMIRLLSKRDYYADEFAKEINIANSTVSYHLSILFLEGIIKTTKIDKKTYFSLRKKKLKKSIEKATNNMLEISE